MPSSRKPLSVAALVLAVVALVVLGCQEGKQGGEGKAAEAAPEPIVKRAPVRSARRLPNVVFIYTDDQEEALFTRRFMPHTFRSLVDKGTLFEDSVTATPICCPSRVSYISGQYPHNSGVFSNSQGYPAFVEPENTLFAWMQRAGYTTAWFGKYLQRYEKEVNPKIPAPGTDEWAITVQPKYFDYSVFGDGKRTRPEAYNSDFLTHRAIDLIKRSEGSGRPFFMTLNYLAPHKGAGRKPGYCQSSAAPAPRDVGRFRDLALPRPPSFDEEDNADKRAYPDEELLTPAKIRTLRIKHRCRAESLQAVDRGVKRVVGAVSRAGELDRTVFVVTSDNGFLKGEHRLAGKGIPYEEGIGVPLAIRVPPAYLDTPNPSPRVDELVTNIDLAPTILDLAESKPCANRDLCRRLDGRSLLPLIAGRSNDWPGDRTILIEGGGKGEPRCDYRGVRTTDEVLLERTEAAADGKGCVAASEPELYDLRADPFQLENLVVTDQLGNTNLLNEMRSQLERLERCSGVRGRDPNQPGPFCE